MRRLLRLSKISLKGWHWERESMARNEDCAKAHSDFFCEEMCIVRGVLRSRKATTVVDILFPVIAVSFVLAIHANVRSTIYHMEQTASRLFTSTY